MLAPPGSGALRGACGYEQYSTVCKRDITGYCAVVHYSGFILALIFLRERSDGLLAEGVFLVAFTKG